MRNELGGRLNTTEFQQFSPGLVNALGIIGIASVGVMPLFYDEDGRVLVVKQKKTKKVPEGGISLPAETSKYKSDGTIELTEQTIARVAAEELGAPHPELLDVDMTHNQPMPPFIFKGDRLIYAYMPMIRLNDSAAIVRNFKENDEIEAVGLMTSDELRTSQLRHGMSTVVRMVMHYQPLLHADESERVRFRLPAIDPPSTYAGDVRLDRQGLIRK